MKLLIKSISLLVLSIIFFTGCSKKEEANVNQQLIADFEVSISNNGTVPAEVTVINKSLGAISYKWIFNGADAENTSSTTKSPGNIIYKNAGEYTITLQAFNGYETKTITKTIYIKAAQVQPDSPTPLVVDFDFSPNNELAPSIITITNKTTGATSYKWTFTGGKPASSENANPGNITYASAGNYTITLVASNEKETKTISKNLTVRTNAIISYSNIYLGGKNNTSYGSLFSTLTGDVYKVSELNSTDKHNIDVAYVGTDGLNFFASPDNIANWGFQPIPNALFTAVINYIESSNISFTPEMFDKMVDDSAIANLSIKQDHNTFPSNSIPRIILFKNSRGKIGVIKILEIKAGSDGYIRFDLKIQR